MPELPEVETMCRGIAAVAGRRIQALRFPKSRLRSIPISPRPAAFRRRVEGRSITAVRRVGKRVVLDLDSSDAIVFEPRMSGRVHLAGSPDTEHIRVVVEFADDSGPLIFWSMRGLSTLCLLTARSLPSRLGRTASALTLFGSGRKSSARASPGQPPSDQGGPARSACRGGSAISVHRRFSTGSESIRKRAAIGFRRASGNGCRQPPSTC